MNTPTETTRTEELQAVGRCAYESISKMVAALHVDYDRLEELQEERDEYDDEHGHVGTNTDNFAEAWALVNPGDCAELNKLEKASGDCKSEEDAFQCIQEDPLSLQVRSGWYSPGEPRVEAEEFELLLTTGGPAVRIIGELGRHNEPDRARLQSQNWGTLWTDCNDTGQDILLAYCSVFYFGD